MQPNVSLDTIHCGMDQCVGECACGWIIALSACGGFSAVNNVIFVIDNEPYGQRKLTTVSLF